MSVPSSQWDAPKKRQIVQDDAAWLDELETTFDDERDYEPSTDTITKAEADRRY